MLIKCPKCGFQQPIDRYCAQCGVDMESFRPPAQPFFKKVVGNPLVQLSVLVVTASGVGYYIYQRGQETLQQRVTYLKSTVQINSASSQLNPPPPPPPEVAGFQGQEGVTDAQDLASQQAGGESAAVTNASAAASTKSPASTDDAKSLTDKDKKDGKDAAKVSAPHLVVYYAEVSRGTLNSVFEASQGTGQFMSFKDYTAGILPGVDKRIKGAGVLLLHKEDRPIDSSKTLQWFYGLKDRRNPSVEIGFTTFFELNDVDENGNLRGNLEIQRTWREGPPGSSDVQRKSFPAIFEIGSGTGFFMSGVMPTQSNLENEDELTSIDVYKILHSPRFRAGDSEFVIFIEFVKGN
ncbi:hypothetical protein DOE51_15935 [Bdellovibrio sp. NC01]|nr:hypothetical protein DOE51_15935 [Bdellovibrio sp. NC01]